MESGKVIHPERGTPQGGVMSPLLSHLDLHEVLDGCGGGPSRFALPIEAAWVFEREADARRLRAVLAKRFAKYGLRLHPDKP